MKRALQHPVKLLAAAALLCASIGVQAHSLAPEQGTHGQPHKHGHHHKHDQKHKHQAHKKHPHQPASAHTKPAMSRYEVNALKRCDVFKTDVEREACAARVRAPYASGSVKGGGVIREHTIQVPVGHMP